jgi:hypothetical protein
MLDFTAGYLMTLLIALAAAIVFAVAWYVWGRIIAAIRRHTKTPGESGGGHQAHRNVDGGGPTSARKLR